MALVYFRMLFHEILKKYPDIVPEESSLIILESKSDVCMSKNGKGINHTRHFVRIVNFCKEWRKVKNAHD